MELEPPGAALFWAGSGTAVKKVFLGSGLLGVAQGPECLSSHTPGHQAEPAQPV